MDWSFLSKYGTTPSWGLEVKSSIFILLECMDKSSSFCTSIDVGFDQYGAGISNSWAFTLASLFLN